MCKELDGFSKYPKCIKCGSEWIEIVYIPPKHHDEENSFLLKEINEYLLCKCVCGYKWRMKTKDNSEIRLND